MASADPYRQSRKDFSKWNFLINLDFLNFLLWYLQNRECCKYFIYRNMWPILLSIIRYGFEQVRHASRIQNLSLFFSSFSSCWVINIMTFDWINVAKHIWDHLMTKTGSWFILIRSATKLIRSGSGISQILQLVKSSVATAAMLRSE